MNVTAGTIAKEGRRKAKVARIKVGKAAGKSTKMAEVRNSAKAAGKSTKMAEVRNSAKVAGKRAKMGRTEVGNSAKVAEVE